MKNHTRLKSIGTKVLLVLLLASTKIVPAQNVGIGTVNPLQKLHIAGATSSLRIDGVATGGSYISAPTANTDNLLFSDAAGDIHKMPNGTSGQIPVINNFGSMVWANAPVKYAVTGTGPAVLSNVAAPVLMPQMTITFIPKSSTVWVFFFAMGSASSFEKPIQFQLRKAGVPVIQFRASSEDSMGNEWASSMSFPVSVTPGVPVSIDITWCEITGFGGYQVVNSGANPICRSLMVLDM
ncbi:MAG: hypothetical protein ABI855_03630 [Bacteroidota bacterium]